ncbi:uncharacterized protein PFL1_06322 [Pseudozyma flocculosa PF-1]|uniref:Glycosylphosphatidylinositol anchor biosynthesis protein 11 n=2 Tax=Pseudozyma flocculosa TaxID=84751 RepID=A0A5C3FAM6_9BASI|nr:uncharacterized protein PFL1_06322 [Pseudozyma flocculosa PF-1]EPQ26114.1 hypothetical protein PFL1_06322 [Pseudozyma flocculosa PF-1]SPO40359.1 uncharacterized protein PSFLO_05841 [Pseudozyma flocculosa]
MARHARRIPPPSGAGAMPPSSAAATRSTPRVPNRLNLTIILALQPVFLLATAFFIASPLLADPPHAQSADTEIASKYAARLAATDGAVLVTAAWKALVAVFVVQGWWCTRIARWCRAATQQQPAPTEKQVAASASSSKIKAAAAADGQPGDERIGKRDVEDVALSIFSLPLLVVFFNVVVILFGAPVSALKSTTLLSCYLALLVGLPLVHVLGVPFLSLPSPSSSATPRNGITSAPSASGQGGEQHLLWTQLVTLDIAHHPAILPLVVPAVTVLSTAATLGTAALALDWERQWQTFPLPCIAAAVAGLMAGNTLTAVWAWRQ